MDNKLRYLVLGVVHDHLLTSGGQGMLSCTIGRISRITKDDFTPTQHDVFGRSQLWLVKVVSSVRSGRKGLAGDPWVQPRRRWGCFENDVRSLMTSTSRD
jgi:hypothetical protein